MSRLMGWMKMLSGVFTPIGAVFAMIAVAVLLAMLVLFSMRVPAFFPVLAVLMALLLRWGGRFSDHQERRYTQKRR